MGMVRAAKPTAKGFAGLAGESKQSPRSITHTAEAFASLLSVD